MRYASQRRTSFLALVAVVALGLSACSSSTPATKTTASASTSALPTGNSAEALFQRMRVNGAAAKSVHIKGTMSNGATGTKAVKVQIDIAGDPSGKNNKAVIDDGTGAMELLTVGGKTYLKGDAAYWTKNGMAANAKLVAGKYLAVPAASAAKMNENTVGKLLVQIYSSASGALSTKVTKTAVNGLPAFLLTTKANDTKIYVSANDPTLLLRVEGTKGQLSAWDFTEWNAVPLVAAPPASQVATLPAAKPGPVASPATP